MKRRYVIFSLILLLFVISTAYAASDSSSSTSTTSTSTSSSTSTSTNIDDAALVYVSNVTMDSGSYFPGDEGTATVTLTNGYTSAIGLSHPDIISDHLSVQEDPWQTMSFIGAGSTITYSVS
ncbi:MAG: hypothetical protein ABSG28_09570, partial [Methanoregula sp.]